MFRITQLILSLVIIPAITVLLFAGVSVTFPNLSENVVLILSMSTAALALGASVWFLFKWVIVPVDVIVSDHEWEINVRRYTPLYINDSLRFPYDKRIIELKWDNRASDRYLILKSPVHGSLCLVPEKSQRQDFDRLCAVAEQLYR